MRISRELNLDMDVYSTRETFEKVKAYRTYRKFSTDLTHFPILSPEDVLEILPDFPENQLLISVFARSGSVSSFSGMDSLPQRMEKENANVDHLFIYPSQSDSDLIYAAYDDMNGSPLTAGVETFQRLSKEVGGMFKKSEE
ncbi:hypothetical protein D3C86_1548010 [compost metagenome]